MNLIQAQLGHTSLATTSRYLAHIAPAQLIAAMRARTWRPPAGRPPRRAFPLARWLMRIVSSAIRSCHSS
jgi:hypothetical protein